MDGSQTLSKSPCAMLAVLCPTAWLAPKQRRVDLEGVEDYKVCLVSTRETWGFPAGSTEPADVALAKAAITDGSDPLPLAIRITAIRRTFESAGMCIGIKPPPRFAREHVREVLHRKGFSSFADFIGDFHGFGALRPYSIGDVFSCVVVPDLPHGTGLEWQVFIAQVPDAEEATLSSAGYDDTQILWWTTPSEALRLHEQKELDLPFPVWSVLRELREHLPAVGGLSDLVSGKFAGNRSNRCCACQVGSSSGFGQTHVWLALPGDEEHLDQPGDAGCRRRALVDAASGHTVIEFEVAGAAHPTANAHVITNSASKMSNSRL